MYRVMIVEDELFVREHIKRCICWEDEGFTIAAEAENGEEALDKMATTAFDLVLLDINMPKMDGLTFAKICREKHPLTQLCILSGYSDFNYAKEAIQLQISDYLLKPIDEEALMPLLKKISKHIAKEKLLHRRLTYLKENVGDIALEERKRVVNRFLYEADNQALTEATDHFCHHFPDAVFTHTTSIIMGIDTGGETPLSVKEANLRYFVLRNVAEEILSTQCRVCSVVNPGRFISLLLWQETTEIPADYVMAKTYRILHYMHKTYDCKLTVCLGGHHSGVQGFRTAHRQALRLYDNRILQRDKSVMAYGDTPIKDCFHHLTSVFKKDMLKALQHGGKEAVMATVEKYTLAIADSQGSMDDVIQLCYTLYGMMKDHFPEEAAASDNPFFLGLKSPLLIEEHLSTVASLHGLLSWLDSLISPLFEGGHAGSKDGSNPYVLKALTYIDACYGDADLSLETVATHVALNATYLSSLFKKTCNQSVIEYITERRMSAAKELIEKDPLTIKEVAERVGYKDAYYFSKCFKKHYGISASKYIRQFS